jgi:hypothetical protein
MREVFSRMVPVAVLAAALTLGACSDESVAPTATTELDGPTVAVGNGTARTVVIEQGGRVSSIGIQLTDGALTGLPATMPMTEWQLSLRAGVGAGP